MGIISFIFNKIGNYKTNQLLKQGMQIGEGSQILSPGLILDEPYLISLGKHVSVASGVRFIVHDGATWVFRSQERYRNVIKYGRITIHDNCIIGLNSVLLPGITIGPNSVVAAGSVVTGDVAPGMIVRGNPAKVVAKVEDYAEICLEKTPDYDLATYKSNKKKLLLQLYPYPW